MTNSLTDINGCGAGFRGAAPVRCRSGMSGHAPAASGPGHLRNWQAWIEPCKQALLGVLEEQAVSVAKAGLCATFPARTGVIAAANPHKVLILVPVSNPADDRVGQALSVPAIAGVLVPDLYILAAEGSCVGWPETCCHAQLQAAPADALLPGTVWLRPLLHGRLRPSFVPSQLSWRILPGLGARYPCASGEHAAAFLLLHLPQFRDK